MPGGTFVPWGLWWSAGRGVLGKKGSGIRTSDISRVYLRRGDDPAKGYADHPAIRR